MLISVIIPHYNGIDHLQTCLTALREQTYPDIEVILADNGSQDESVAFVQENFPAVRVLELGHNLGLATAINRATRIAQGDIIAPLNNDTEVAPQWAEALVQRLNEFPEAGIVASKMLLFDQRNTLHSAGDGFGRDGIPVNRGVWQKDEGQFDNDTYIFGGCGGAVAYRRTMLDEIGLFDEDLFMYLEDVDLNWRAQLAGYKAVFAPNAVVYHHLSATGGGAFASYYTGRNTILVLLKALPAPLLRKYWPQIIRAQLNISYDALKAWRGEAARARLKGQLTALAHMPRWLSKRRKVQQQTHIDADVWEQLIEQ